MFSPLKLKTFISRSNLNVLSSSFFANIHILIVENHSAVKKIGSEAVLGWSFLDILHIEGQKGGYPLNFFSSKGGFIVPVLNIRVFSSNKLARAR